jgi:hypothetical protein
METTIPSLEVTLRHESFGEFAFRCEPSEAGNVIADMLGEAQKAHDTKAAIAAIDKEQDDLTATLAACDKMIDAATLLEDKDRIAEQQAARQAIEDKIAACSTRRAALAPK